MNTRQVFKVKERAKYNFSRLERFLRKFNQSGVSEKRLMREIRALDYVTNRIVPANSRQKDIEPDYNVEELKKSFGSLGEVVRLKMIVVRKRFKMTRDFSADS